MFPRIYLIRIMDCIVRASKTQKTCNLLNFLSENEEYKNCPQFRFDNEKSPHPSEKKPIRFGLMGGGGGVGMCSWPSFGFDQRGRGKAVIPVSLKNNKENTLSESPSF
jgi:hypothetical protein